MAENLLRCDNKPGADTRRMVRETLALLIDWHYATENREALGMPSTGVSLGAGHILRMCQNALEEGDGGECGQ